MYHAGEAELAMHGRTLGDVSFVEDLTNRSSLLISGAGDCKMYITDCETATPFQSLSGHSGTGCIHSRPRFHREDSSFDWNLLAKIGFVDALWS